jgi:hypothetical protein
LHTASVPHIHQLSTPDVKFLGRESAQVAGWEPSKGGWQGTLMGKMLVNDAYQNGLHQQEINVDWRIESGLKKSTEDAGLRCHDSRGWELRSYRVGAAEDGGAEAAPYK